MQIPEAIDPVEAVQHKFGDEILGAKVFRGDVTIVVKPGSIERICRFLRDTGGLIYNYLSDISPVDYYPDHDRPGRFGVAYHLYSMLYNRSLRVKTYLDEDEPVVPTVSIIWPGANWLEREAHDMMGIVFDGHPDLRRLLMPDDWNGHPHRRDYPLGYETVQFSFNVEEIMKHKPFAKQ